MSALPSPGCIRWGWVAGLGCPSDSTEYHLFPRFAEASARADLEYDHAAAVLAMDQTGPVAPSALATPSICGDAMGRGYGAGVTPSLSAKSHGRSLCFQMSHHEAGNLVVFVVSGASQELCQSRTERALQSSDLATAPSLRLRTLFLSILTLLLSMRNT